MARRNTLISVANRLGLPILGRLGGTKFLPWKRELERSVLRPVEERRAEQLRLLNELLATAVRDVPLYRERFAGTAAEKGLTSLDQLQELPITTKRELMAGFPDRVTNETMDRGDWQFVSTSGTVNRVVTVKDFHRRDWERAAALHMLTAACGYKAGLKILEIPPNICNIICGEGATNEDESFRGELWKQFKRLVGGKKPDWSDLRGAFERRVVYRMRMLQPLAPTGTHVEEERLRSYWDRIRRERPYLLHALPEYLYLLANWALENNLPKLGVPFITPMGSSTPNSMRRRIEEGLGGEFLDIYGTAELGPVAFESTGGEGLRPIMELFVVEFVRNGRPAKPGELCSVLLTDLRNHAMPFIRYEVGDVGRWYPAPEGAADQAPRFRVTGRLDQTLLDAEGEPLPAERVRDSLHEQGDCVAFSLKERPKGRLQLDYVPREAAEEHGEAVATLQELVGDSYRIRARRVRNIASESSGKFRFISCEPGIRSDGPDG